MIFSTSYDSLNNIEHNIISMIKNTKKEDLLNKNDLIYVIDMIILDIIAPIMLMYGLKSCTSGNASLLNNFEIVTIKGLCCGLGSLIIGICIGERFKNYIYIVYALFLGFVSYGLSIFFISKHKIKLEPLKRVLSAINPFIA
ncbi:hypothetical protein PIROE2DRAFT_9577 [Piromyces sp. E2]|nr:hypothetical protein PIROE2DRAFT_9577 [Piromyces sp. E2]|eukprot:OUM63836.1 hypothetical protein PIROE2DRAFT_9577 [Piromyces sp. E2]